MQKRAILAMFIGAIAISSAAALAAGKGPAAGKTVKVGVIADVTGSAAVYGTSQKNAYELATDDLRAGRIDAGGATVNFDIQDPASDPAQVANIFQKFTGDGTAIVLGPTLSSEAKKADPIAVKAGLPVLATSNTAQGITAMGPCVFRDSLAEEQIVPDVMRKTMAKWHMKTVAIIYGDDDQFTKTDYVIFKENLDREHIPIVDIETYHKKDVDFQAQLTKIKEKNPDVLVVGALFEEASKILIQARKLGLHSHVIGGNGFNAPKLIELAGEAARGAVVGSAWYIDNNFTGNRAFVARYKKKFGLAPDQFAAQAYAAAQIVAHLVKTGATTPPAMCEGLRKLTVVQTVLGPVAFDQARDVRAASAIVEIGSKGFQYFR